MTEAPPANNGRGGSYRPPPTPPPRLEAASAEATLRQAGVIGRAERILVDLTASTSPGRSTRILLTPLRLVLWRDDGRSKPTVAVIDDPSRLRLSTTLHIDGATPVEIQGLAGADIAELESAMHRPAPPTPLAMATHILAHLGLLDGDLDIQLSTSEDGHVLRLPGHRMHFDADGHSRGLMDDGAPPNGR